jgi:hypothetical protein
MKNLIFVALFSFSLIIKAQNAGTSGVLEIGSKHDLARLIKTRVLIKDVTTINTVLLRYGSTQPVSGYIKENYFNYLERANFLKLSESLLKLAHKEGTFVYHPMDINMELTRSEIESRLYYSSPFYDMNGENLYDSVQYTPVEITAIDFYESWFFNEKTGMIEKDVLAYKLLIDYKDASTEEIKAYKPLFYIAANHEKWERLCQFHFNN